ncbi:phospholipase C [Acididesulfobacillus acetoxydans]|uniref:Phospholipase C n=1 Tax=Acididesulfobacillus acetoxydans TaxID=1561005 RepID=A0A8S0W756_9FIRM|nr:zinc dependent phospholipase C family protein [Acididesulfobacillus acetoxydans]CAA7600389.1 phospholipase C [Acididesulfobacillus acetoxydans]CEJ07911.1 Transcriptional antiterminator [Acididesulfobacillus acetoxydans]
MKQEILGQTIGRLTKMFLAPIGPLQYLFDTPGVTHVHCLEQAYDVLTRDGKADVATFFRPYHASLGKGLLWADRGWKNVHHFYSKPGKGASILWPGATAECQYYYNRALTFMDKDVFKGMFFLGAALHLIQDMCVPHHSVGMIFNGHQEFEKWAARHWSEFPLLESGSYPNFSHPSQWVEYNAKISRAYYSRVSWEQGNPEPSYTEAARKLIPLTIGTTAGFLDFVRKKLTGVTLSL